jgi:coproporphyrinogen III oxidase-like Fe-S oxidoreductase
MKEINIDLIKDNWQSLIKEIEKKEVSDLITLTIHVPFCSQKCKFCNCYVRKSDHKVLENFMNILEEQIKEFSFIFKEYTFKRLFIS